MEGVCRHSPGVGEQMQGLHQTMFESMGTASWQERRNLMNQMFQARRQAADTVHDAATKLMSALTSTEGEGAVDSSRTRLRTRNDGPALTGVTAAASLSASNRFTRRRGMCDSSPRAP